MGIKLWVANGLSGVLLVGAYFASSIVRTTTPKVASSGVVFSDLFLRLSARNP